MRKNRNILGIIKTKDLTFEYIRRDEDGNVDVEITKQFVDNVMNWSKKNENNL